MHVVTPSGDRKSATRRKVLTEAGRALRRHGPNRLVVSQVMASAGLTHGGFYAHFASKADLIAAAIDDMFDIVSRPLAMRDPAASHQTVLKNFIDYYLSVEHRDSEVRGCPLSYLAGDAPRLEGGGRERYAAGMARLRGLLTDEMQGDEAGALSLLSEAVGALALSRAEPDAERADAILAASRDAIIRRFVGQLEKRPFSIEKVARSA